MHGLGRYDETELISDDEMMRAGERIGQLSALLDASVMEEAENEVRLSISCDHSREGAIRDLRFGPSGNVPGTVSNLIPAYGSRSNG